MISLEARVHNLWNIGYFALNPLWISDDKKELDVRDFWQPPSFKRIRLGGTQFSNTSFRSFDGLWDWIPELGKVRPEILPLQN